MLTADCSWKLLQLFGAEARGFGGAACRLQIEEIICSAALIAAVILKDSQALEAHAVYGTDVLKSYNYKCSCQCQQRQIERHACGQETHI